MSNVPEKLQPWIEARKKYSLTHAQIQMARELGLKPAGLEKQASSWLRENQSLAGYIEDSYRKRFKKDCPDDIRSIEERLVDRKIRKNLKEGKSAGIAETASSLRFRFMKYLTRLKPAEKKPSAGETAIPDQKNTQGTIPQPDKSAHRSEAEIIAKFWTSITGLK